MLKCQNIHPDFTLCSQLRVTTCSCFSEDSPLLLALRPVCRPGFRELGNPQHRSARGPSCFSCSTWPGFGPCQLPLQESVQPLLVGDFQGKLQSCLSCLCPAPAVLQWDPRCSAPPSLGMNSRNAAGQSPPHCNTAD